MYSAINAAGESRQAPCCTLDTLPDSTASQIKNRILKCGYLPPAHLVCVSGLYAGRDIALTNDYDLIGSDADDEAVTLAITDCRLARRHLFISKNPASLAYPLKIMDFSPASATESGVYVKVRHLHPLPLLDESQIYFEYLRPPSITSEQAFTPESIRSHGVDPLTGCALNVTRGPPLSEKDAFWDLLWVFEIPRGHRYALVIFLSAVPNCVDLFEAFKLTSTETIIENLKAPKHMTQELTLKLDLMHLKFDQYLPWQEKSRPLILKACGRPVAEVRWSGARLVPTNAPFSLPLPPESAVEYARDVIPTDELVSDEENLPAKASDDCFRRSVTATDGYQSPILSGKRNPKCDFNRSTSSPAVWVGNRNSPAWEAAVRTLWWDACYMSSQDLDLRVSSHPHVPLPYKIPSGSPDRNYWSRAYDCVGLFNNVALGLPLFSTLMLNPNVFSHNNMPIPKLTDNVKLYRTEKWLQRTPLQCQHFKMIPTECFPEVRLPPLFGSGYHLTITFEKGDYYIKETFPADSTDFVELPPCLRPSSYQDYPSNETTPTSFPVVDIVDAIWVTLPSSTSDQDQIIASTIEEQLNLPLSIERLPREVTVDHSLDQPTSLAWDNKSSMLQGAKNTDEEHTIISEEDPLKNLEECGGGGLTKDSNSKSFNTAIHLRFGDILRIGSLIFELRRFNQGTAGLQGCRLKMEDEEVGIQDLAILEDLPVSFYGIYDGHGGRECASFLREELHLQFKHHLEVLAGDLNRSTHIEKAIFESLYRAFVIADRVYVRSRFNRPRQIPPPLVASHRHPLPGSHYGSPGPSGAVNTGGSGSAAIVIVIVGNQIWCANTGDTRCLICRGDQAVQLSLDHKPDRSDELHRIHQSGGFIRNRRVLGRLAVSRAFGDIEYKNVGSNLNALVVPDPEIRLIYNIQPDDQFLLLACDGLYDVYESQELVQTIRKMLVAEPSAQLVVEELVLDAIENRMSQDNVSATLIVFQ